MYWLRSVGANKRDGGLVCCCNCDSRFIVTMNGEADSGCFRKMRHQVPPAPAV